jgi:hypothetical protein
MQNFCIVRHLQTIKDNYIKDRERYNKLVSTVPYTPEGNKNLEMQLQINTLVLNEIGPALVSNSPCTPLS